MQIFHWTLPLPVNLKILNDYHPLAKIEYQILNNEANSKPVEYVMDFTFSTKAHDLEEAQMYFQTLGDTISDLHTNKKAPLTFLDIGNLLYIVHKYTLFESPSTVIQHSHNCQEFREIITMLQKLKQNRASIEELYFQIRNRRNYNEVNEVLIEIDDNRILSDVLLLLEQKYNHKLIQLRDNILGGPDEEYPYDLLTLIARAIYLGDSRHEGNINIYTKTYDQILESIDRTTPEHEIQDDFLRMLYKTMQEYLENETLIKTKENIDGNKRQTNSHQFRIIYILCSTFGLVPQLADKSKHTSSVRDIIKNFKTDKRLKIVKTISYKYRLSNVKVGNPAVIFSNIFVRHKRNDGHQIL
jgi:hypothetical protein